jgi:hypothetical protein
MNASPAIKNHNHPHHHITRHRCNFFLISWIQHQARHFVGVLNNLVQYLRQRLSRLDKVITHVVVMMNEIQRD